mgnify:CR=1 FL=1
MSLSRDDVAKVATLARLALSEDELAQMTRELSKIVGFVSLLEELDTSSVEPLAHPLGTTNVFREDEPAPSLPVELAIATAPKQDGECFLVPAAVPWHGPSSQGCRHRSDASTQHHGLDSRRCSPHH